MKKEFHEASLQIIHLNDDVIVTSQGSGQGSGEGGGPDLENP